MDISENVTSTRGMSHTEPYRWSSVVVTLGVREVFFDGDNPLGALISSTIHEVSVPTLPWGEDGFNR